MLDYMTLGSSDLKRSKHFYDATLATLSIFCFHSDEESVAYRNPAQHSPSLWLTKPFNGQLAQSGNGCMQAFKADSTAQVQAFHAAALTNGGLSEGEAGYRLQYSPDFYAAYVRDPDGNKLAAVFRDSSKLSDGL